MILPCSSAVPGYQAPRGLLSVEKLRKRAGVDVIIVLWCWQMPAVEGIGTDAALLYEAESEEVVIARDTFASVRQYVISLQEEVCIRSVCPFTMVPTLTTLHPQKTNEHVRPSRKRLYQQAVLWGNTMYAACARRACLLPKKGVETVPWLLSGCLADTCCPPGAGGCDEAQLGHAAQPQLSHSLTPASLLLHLAHVLALSGACTPTPFSFLVRLSQTS